MAPTVSLPIGALKLRSIATCSHGYPVSRLDQNPSLLPQGGKYTFENGRVLGVGAYGIVRWASDKAVAVKSVTRDQGCAVEAMARQEIDVLRQLKSHPNISKMLDSFEDASHIHIALEYIDGYELFDEIARQLPMNRFRAASVIRQVCDALSHCHSLSIIHRDVKPENVMVRRKKPREENLSVVLIDFGLAISCTDDSVEAPVQGSANFLAPEVLAKGQYSMASDMWSTGVMLFMMLSGGSLPSKSRGLCEPDVKKSNVLVNALLKPSPPERLTAVEAASHPWATGCHFNGFRKFCNACKNDDANSPVSTCASTTLWEASEDEASMLQHLWETHTKPKGALEQTSVVGSTDIPSAVAMEQ